jgi:hypothetical protein
MTPALRRTTLALTLATSALAPAALVTSETSCKSPAQAEAGIFTFEQVLCMVVPLADGVLTGTPEEVAKALEGVCPSLQGFTAQVIDFVTKWFAQAPAQRAAWKAWAAANRKSAADVLRAVDASAAPPAR